MGSEKRLALLLFFVHLNLFVLSLVLLGAQYVNLEILRVIEGYLATGDLGDWDGSPGLSLKRTSVVVSFILTLCLFSLHWRRIEKIVERSREQHREELKQQKNT